MENMWIADDSTAYFLSDEQDVGIVVTETEGEVLRLRTEDKKITFGELDLYHFIDQNEPVSESDIFEEYTADKEPTFEVIDELRQRGEIYQPQKGTYRVVPEQPDKSNRK